MKIYTKKGDLGETDLCDGKKHSKSSLRVKALGSVDETNSVIGIAVSQTKSNDLKKILEMVQGNLFAVQGELAFAKNCSVSEKMVSCLEKEIDKIELMLPPLRKFIVPGGSRGGSCLHFCRAVCRRTETLLCELNEKEKLNPEILKYFNRLADLLFVMARLENKRNKILEKKT